MTMSDIIQTSVIIPDTNGLEPVKMLGNQKGSGLKSFINLFPLLLFFRQDIPVANGNF